MSYIMSILYITQLFMSYIMTILYIIQLPSRVKYRSHPHLVQSLHRKSWK